MIYIKNNNLFSLLYQAGENNPEGIFFSFDDLPVTYIVAKIKTQKLANFLKDNGINKGDKILLSLGNIPEFIYFYLAIAQVGAISILVNPESKRYELKYIIDETIPKLVIIENNKINDLKVEDNFFIDRDKIIVVDEYNDESFLHYNLKDGNELLYYEKLNSNETISIIFTSAMEGFPLGAMLTHNGIFQTIIDMEQYSKNDDILLTVLPLFHTFGLITAFLLPLSYGLLFYLEKQFSPKRIINILNKYKITSFFGVPLMFKVVSIFLKKGEKLPYLKLCISGGDVMDVELQKEFFNRFDVEIREGYGVTEASPIITWNNLKVKNKLGSVGVPMKWNDIRIVDKGVDVPDNCKGEVIVKGVNIINSYYNNNEATEKYIIDDWFYTGDTGYIDEEGYLFLTGMKKDMILSFGFNVYPKEVERILEYNSEISKVDISIKKKAGKNSDGDFLEAVVYTSNKEIDADSVKKWCKGNISRYKIPKKIVLEYVD